MINILLLIVVWGLYLGSCWIYIRRGHLSMRMGLNLGILHMVLVPFSVFAYEGGLAGDAGGVVPSVDWAAQSHTVLKILAMVGLYGVWDLICNMLSRGEPPPPRPGQSIWDTLPSIKPIYLVVTFIIGTTAIFVIAGRGSGGLHWADAKSEFLLSYGTPAILVLNFVNAIRLGALITMATLYWLDQIPLKRFLLIIMAICLVDLYTTGNRIFTLQAIVVIVTLFIVRRQWFLVLIFGLAAIPFGVLMTMFALIRVYMHRWTGGGSGGLSSATAALGEGYLEAKDYFLPSLGISEFLMGISEGVNVNVLIVVVEDFHRSVGLLMGTGLLRGFVFWIPRSIWPGKPESLPILIGQHLMGGDRVSMGATIFGEFWANFGFLGVFMIPVVIYAINLGFKVMIRNPTMRIIATFIFGYTVVRMPISDLTVQFLFITVILNMTRLGDKKTGLPAQ